MVIIFRLGSNFWKSKKGIHLRKLSEDILEHLVSSRITRRTDRSYVCRIATSLKFTDT